jgi:DNA-3-methyladenine glycosylase II
MVEPTSPAYWIEATRALSARDAILAQLITHHRAFIVGSRGDAFQTLARAIVGQQISVKAAQSVWTRLVDCVRIMQPQAVVQADSGMLRAAGLSQRKAEYVQDLARRFHEGSIDVADWGSMDDEAIIEQLTAVRGIGRWTAEMYLIFNLARPDVLPVGDLGLQRALSIQYNRGRPLSQRKLRTVTKPWMPWRSVATWYMWRSLETTDAEIVKAR